MSAPTATDAPLHADEIEALSTRVSDLLAERDDGVGYPTDTTRRSADAFARALREEPTAALRALQLSLRRVQLDVQEDGPAGRRAEA